jgi:hypothetical protein
VVWHSNTPSETLSQITHPSKGNDISKLTLQKWVANNPNTSASTLEQWADFAGNKLGQPAVDTNMKTSPLEMELSAANQAHLRIALNLALNPSTPNTRAKAMAMQFTATQPWRGPLGLELPN